MKGLWECQESSLVILEYTDPTYMLVFSRKRYFVSEYTPIDSNIAFPVFARDKGRHTLVLKIKGLGFCWHGCSFPQPICMHLFWDTVLVLRTQL